MEDFNHYLDKTGEVGYVEESIGSLVYASGLPHAKTMEVVLFEDGKFGQVLSLTPKYTEILLFSKIPAQVGGKIARTGNFIEVEVGEHLFGMTVDPLGHSTGGNTKIDKDSKRERRQINIDPLPISERIPIQEPLTTGVSIIDLVVPLAKGQRELVIGDRKAGKTSFLLQSLLSQANSGTVCIYGAIAKKAVVIARIQEFIKKKAIGKNTILVATASSDSAGSIFLTPYTAMTIAEHFRDQGRDVFVVLDDLTAHAKFYREITLLARRFPGRSSYPGDIFYAHSRLLERAGNFKKAAITCLPVAETVMGDISGYIQTNLMSMTDGHIYFDTELANLGRRPSVNPFLSVTRVGSQTQAQVLRDASRQLSSFLIHYKRLQDFMHFGAELTEKVQRELAQGNRIIAMFEQGPSDSISINVSLSFFALVWAGLFKEVEIEKMKLDKAKMVTKYAKDKNYRNQVDNLITNSKTFADLVNTVKKQGGIVNKTK